MTESNSSAPAAVRTPASSVAGAKAIRARPLVRSRIHAAALAGRFVVGGCVATSVLLIDTAATDERAWFGYLVASIWVPAVGTLDAVRRRRGATNPIVTMSILVDFGLVLAGAAIAPEAWLVLLGVQFPMVAFYAYGYTRIYGGAAIVLSVITVFVAAPDDGAMVSAPSLLVVHVAVVVCLVLLQWGAAAAHREVVGGLARLTEKEELIIAGVAEAIVVTEPQGRIKQWNPSATRTFHTPAGDAIGTGCGESLGLRRDIAELDCSQGCALFDGRSTAECEVWRSADDSSRQPLLATVSPVVDDVGHVVEIVHSFRDITSLKQADEAKTLFLATASHELKTPLAVIEGFSDLMLKTNLPDDRREAALVAMNERAAQLRAIVDRLLLTSRIEAGRVDLELGPIDLASTLVERVQAVRDSQERSIVLHLPAGPLPAARGDAHALATVVDHLIDNALKYSPGSEPVTVSLEVTNNALAVSVSDLGAGMDDAQRERCFEKFWQADTSDSRRFGGAGIGLYIVRSLVEAMDATIGVESALGAGSTFRVEFERADRAVEAERAPLHVRPAGIGDGEGSIIGEFMRQIGVRAEGAS